MMTETMLSVYSCCKQCQRVWFSHYTWKYSTVQQNDSYVTVSSRLKEHWRWRLYQSINAILGTDNDSLSVDGSDRSSW